MRNAPARVPEADRTGGAIHDEPLLDMDGYSRFCVKYLAREYRNLVRLAVEELHFAPTGRVLEIGSGPGWIGIFLAGSLPGAEIVALELSDDMRRVSEANRITSGVENLRYVAGDAESMPFDDRFFDAVISNGSLHHWTAPVRVLSEVTRVLSPGGAFVIQDGRRDLGWKARAVHAVLSRLPLLDSSVPGKQMRRGWKESIAAGYTPSELAEMADASGLAGWSLRESLFDLALCRRALPS